MYCLVGAQRLLREVMDGLLGSYSPQNNTHKVLGIKGLVRRSRRSDPLWEWSLFSDQCGLYKETKCKWKTGPQSRHRQEWCMRFPVRIVQWCTWAKLRGHCKSNWVSIDKHWSEEAPRMELQFMFRRQTTPSTRMEPQSKDELKGSGRVNCESHSATPEFEPQQLLLLPILWNSNLNLPTHPTLSLPPFSCNYLVIKRYMYFILVALLLYLILLRVICQHCMLL